MSTPNHGLTALQTYDILNEQVRNTSNELRDVRKRLKAIRKFRDVLNAALHGMEHERDSLLVIRTALREKRAAVGSSEEYAHQRELFPDFEDPK